MNYLFGEVLVYFLLKKLYYYQNLTPTATYAMMNNHLITIVFVTFHNAEDGTTPDR